VKYLLLGAGLQGRAIAWDLLRHAPDTTALTVVDGNRQALADLESFLADERLRTVEGDVRDQELLAPLLREAQVAISAVNYWHNAFLAGIAVNNRSHFLDLGGNNEIVAQEFALGDRAAEAGVAIIPDCGLAPGLAGILGHHLATSLDRCENLRLRVGGLPADPLPPMNYKLVFSVQGLINEYSEPAVVIREGEIRTVPSLTELETLSFPPPFGELEAFQTSGGTSTLPETLLGRVRNLDYKTIRYPGHCAQIRLLMDLGLCDTAPRRIGDLEIVPREVLASLLEEKLDLPGTDVVLLLAEAEGWDAEGRGLTRRLRIIDREDMTTGLTAMMRMTGFPAAIIARMLAMGDIAARGACRQEEVVPADGMMAALQERGIAVETGSEEGEGPA